MASFRQVNMNKSKASRDIVLDRPINPTVTEQLANTDLPILNVKVQKSFYPPNMPTITNKERRDGFSELQLYLNNEEISTNLKTKPQNVK